jgi:ERCC4-type nuclease
MIIKIDTREHELLRKCQAFVSSDAESKFKNIQFVSTPLPLGDIIINDGTNDCVIIERKTINDLSASIKDGRYDEQSYRLNGIEHHNHNIVYLIEGNLEGYGANKFTKINKQTLYSAMFSINYFKGFSLMRSFSIDETVVIICNMVHKLVNGLKKGKVQYYGNTNKLGNLSLQQDANKEEGTGDEGNIEGEDANKEEDQEPNNEPINIGKQQDKQEEKDYCSVVKKIKKDNITTDNIGEIMLCQIPFVSSCSAIAILAEFKTLSNLIKCIQEDETCLQKILMVDAKGKSRKLSKTVIANIIKYLC